MLHHRANNTCWGTNWNRPIAELAYGNNSWPLAAGVEARRRAIRPDRHEVEPGLLHVDVMAVQEMSQQPNDAWLSLVTPPIPLACQLARWSGEGTVKVTKTACPDDDVRVRSMADVIAPQECVVVGEVALPRLDGRSHPTRRHLFPNVFQPRVRLFVGKWLTDHLVRAQCDIPALQQGQPWVLPSACLRHDPGGRCDSGHMVANDGMINEVARCKRIWQLHGIDMRYICNGTVTKN